MIVTTVATSLYLYFSSFVPSSSLIWWGKQKLWHAVQKTDYVCFIAKIFKNQQFICLSWIFYTECSIQFLTCHMFWVFLFELRKCTWKINIYNLLSFGRLSKCVLTTLIILWEVLYEGSFQVCNGRWWKKILECQNLKLGDAPGTPKKYSRRLKRLSLGMPPCIPFFINNHQFVPRCTIFLSLHALCATLGASRSLLFLGFFCFVF